jgi:hypothetical protein
MLVTVPDGQVVLPVMNILDDGTVPVAPENDVVVPLAPVIHRAAG